MAESADATDLISVGSDTVDRLSNQEDISFSRKDIDFAGKIVQVLEADDLDIWIDWKI